MECMCVESASEAQAFGKNSHQHKQPWFQKKKITKFIPPTSHHIR